MKNVEKIPLYKRWPKLIGYDVYLQRIFHLVGENCLPRTLLLEGRSGIGKSMLAAKIAARHFCWDGNGCGKCGGCQWLLSGNHNDILIFDDNDESLKIADAKILQEHLEIEPELDTSAHPSTRPARIIVVPDVDRFNDTALNKLLKIIEELPEHGMAIFTTSHSDSILDTFLSRCVTFKVPPPEWQFAWKIISNEIFLEEEIQENEVEKLYVRYGRSPGRVLSTIREQGNQGSVQKLCADFVATAKLTDILIKAQEITSDKSVDAGNLSVELEIALNQLYRDILSGNTKDQSALSPSAIRGRRQLLRNLKWYGHKKKIKLNAQLSAEAFGLYHRDKI